MNVEFHIFAWRGYSLFELEIPGEDFRIEFSSLFDAARHVRTHSNAKDATVVIHNQGSKMINRIPLHGDF